MQEELNCIEQHSTCKRVKSPNQAERPLGTIRIRFKLNPNNSIDWSKARLVAKGYSEIDPRHRLHKANLTRSLSKSPLSHWEK